MRILIGIGAIAIIILMTAMNAAGSVRWADKLINYTSELSPKEASAAQALGSPNVMPDFGYSPAAWMPKPVFGRNVESIVLGYSDPIYAQQIAVNENYFSGTIAQIILFDSLDNAQIIYETKAQKLSNAGNVFRAYFEKTKFRVYKVELKVNAAIAYKGMQIDAIALSDEKTDIQINIKNATDNTIDATPINLGEAVNSPWPDYIPIISQDGKKIYFTRDLHPDNTGEQKKQDVWMAAMGKDSNFEMAKNIGYPINNEAHNFAISLSPDGNTLLLGNKYNLDGTMGKGVSISNFKGTNWEFPKPINLNENVIGRNGTYSLASNRKVLLMSTEGDDSHGKEDIYVFFRINDSTWSDPVNLGVQINTASSEIAPYLAADMTTLYFSTDGRPGYGNTDLFISRRLDESWTNWSEPLNLGPKFNTSGWDAYFTIPASGDYAYYVSTNNSIGKEDIFKIKLPDALKPKIVALVSGRVLNAKNYSPIDAEIIYEMLGNNVEAGIARSNPETGEYQIALPAGQNYGFLAKAKDYLSVNENLDLRNVNYYQEIYRDLYLVPVKKGATLRINNIFFEFSKYELLPESFPELNRLAEFMKANTEYKVEIAGHTDDVGAAGVNNALSQNRAKAVAAYLIQAGIDPKRIKTKGYGKSKPIAPNDTEENRAKNRRVEFILL